MTPPSSPIPVSVMIFTLDEEVHLPSCLESLRWTDDVIVIDSFSQDRTAEIARASGARLHQHAFEGFGKQRTWALDNADPKYDWVLILDADERVPPDLAAEIADRVRGATGSIGAFRVKRRFHMWGRWLRFSNLYPTWVVRLVRRGRVHYFNKGHSETQEVQGETAQLVHDLIDENLKGIDEWFARQNRYSTKEALYELEEEKAPFVARALVSRDPMVRRVALKRLVTRMPLRAILYFLYSYILRGGILEGRDGLAFCRMKASYQQMIVAKKHDLRRRAAP
jgi:glycosyltransferase involved in cell wall biosynthesis